MSAATEAKQDLPKTGGRVVRLSKGNFSAEKFETVQKMMNEAETSLRPAISKLPGCISFFVSTDKTSNSLINASVWDSMAHALQMNTLPQMLALFAPFTDAGLAFERPIVNYEVDWQINDGKQDKKSCRVVRLSKGVFPADKFETVKKMMNEAEASLRPAISKLPGCISYFVSTDKGSNSMINLSVWDSVEHAGAMSKLPEMLALFAPFTAAGVTFERPIVNYEIDWQI